MYIYMYVCMYVYACMLEHIRWWRRKAAVAVHVTPSQNIDMLRKILIRFLQQVNPFHRLTKNGLQVVVLADRVSVPACTRKNFEV